jgi:hypothetical protein
MKSLTLSQSERTLSYVGIALGLLVSFALAPKDELFLQNFSFYWGSQLAVILLILLLRPRPAIVATLSFVLATILLGFRIWIATRSRYRPDGGVWFLYLVLLCGAAIGGLGSAWWCRSEISLTPARTVLITCIATIAGSCLIAACACSTGLYCR